MFPIFQGRTEKLYAGQTARFEAVVSVGTDLTFEWTFSGEANAFTDRPTQTESTMVSYNRLYNWLLNRKIERSGGPLGPTGVGSRDILVKYKIHCQLPVLLLVTVWEGYLEIVECGELSTNTNRAKLSCNFHWLSGCLNLQYLIIHDV